jgi:hypothetical protein
MEQAVNGAAASNGQNGTAAEGDYRLRFCTVCASNNNRCVSIDRIHGWKNYR